MREQQTQTFRGGGGGSIHCPTRGQGHRAAQWGWYMEPGAALVIIPKSYCPWHTLSSPDTASHTTGATLLSHIWL